MNFGLNVNTIVMKTKMAIILLGLLLFSSCIVKSLQPFYIKDKVQFQKKLVGNWIDQKNGVWNILSFKDEWEKENSDQTNLSDEDLKAFENYKQGYYINYSKSEKEASFIGIPFMVNGDLFLDLTPFYYETEEINSLAAEHLFKTHSVAKIDDLGNENFSLSFLSEEKIKPLFSENKIRLKHEFGGSDEDLILTASPEELYEFLKQFNKIDDAEKWNEDVYKLKPLDATP